MSTGDEFYQAGVRFVSNIPSRTHVLEWLRDEFAGYADDKFLRSRDVQDQRMRGGGISNESWWYSQVFQYVRRAQIVGIDTPAGRQLLAKTITTLIDCVASSVRVHGPLPEPGHPSGEVVPWTSWGQLDV